MYKRENSIFDYPAVVIFGFRPFTAYPIAIRMRSRFRVPYTCNLLDSIITLALKFIRVRI